MYGLHPLDLNRPVCHLSYFEADAFARYSDARLPTEFEWEFAANSIVPGLPSLNLTEEETSFHPEPASHNHGLRQMFSDAWEWTSSSYAPYPGFKPMPGDAGEYNGKFMVNQYVLRGASIATPAGHSRTTYRNFFPTHARWQFSGVRLARNLG